jgi:hypothetical protein
MIARLIVAGALAVAAVLALALGVVAVVLLR